MLSCEKPRSRAFLDRKLAPRRERAVSFMQVCLAPRPVFQRRLRAPAEPLRVNVRLPVCPSPPSPPPGGALIHLTARRPALKPFASQRWTLVPPAGCSLAPSAPLGTTVRLFDSKRFSGWESLAERLRDRETPKPKQAPALRCQHGALCRRRNSQDRDL